MGEVEEKDNPNPLIEDVKRAIIDFINKNMIKIIHTMNFIPYILI